MDNLRNAVVTAAVITVVAFLAGCQKGPVQKAGERVDRVLGQDPIIGKGPAEKAGKKVDNTVEDIKR
jgi:hypothetical protein